VRRNAILTHTSPGCYTSGFTHLRSERSEAPCAAGLREDESSSIRGIVDALFLPPSSLSSSSIQRPTTRVCAVITCTNPIHCLMMTPNQKKKNRNDSEECCTAYLGIILPNSPKHIQEPILGMTTKKTKKMQPAKNDMTSSPSSGDYSSCEETKQNNTSSIKTEHFPAYNLAPRSQP
jgi:hypothetical protein